MNRLKKLREDKGLLVSDIAKILDITEDQYLKFESSKDKLTYTELMKLADYYKTSIDYILELTDELTPYPPSKEDR